MEEEAKVKLRLFIVRVSDKLTWIDKKRRLFYNSLPPKGPTLDDFDNRQDLSINLISRLQNRSVGREIRLPGYLDQQSNFITPISNPISASLTNKRFQLVDVC